MPSKSISDFAGVLLRIAKTVEDEDDQQAVVSVAQQLLSADQELTRSGVPDECAMGYFSLMDRLLMYGYIDQVLSGNCRG